MNPSEDTQATLERDRAARLHPLIIVAVCALIFFGMYWQYSLPLNHDVAFNIYRSGQVFEGARLFVDFIDPNPPFMFWFGVPAALLASLTGLSAKAAFFIWFYALALISISLTWRQLGGWLGSGGRRVAITLMLLVLVLGFPASAFGQREHVTILLFMPYLFAAVNQARGERAGTPLERILIGLLGACGLMMKVFSLLIWIGLELFLFVTDPRKRSFLRPECLSLMVTGVFGGLMVLLFVPQYLSLSLVLLQTYTAINRSWIEMLFSRANIAWLLLPPAYLIDRSLDRDSTARNLLILTATLGFLEGIVQQKGWGYHFIPGVIIALWFFGIGVYRFIELKLAERSGVRAAVNGAAVILFVGVFSLTFGSRYLTDQTLATERTMIELTRQYARHEPIYYFSDIWLAPVWAAVVEADAEWPCRIADIWNITGYYPPGSTQLNPPARMDAVEKQFYRYVIDDLLADPPRLIIAPDPAEGHFPFLKYYAQDPAFAALLANYRLLTVVVDDSPGADIKRFLVYLRQE